MAKRFDAETTPLLKKNFACENLQMYEDSVVKYQKNGVLANEKNKIIGYDMAKLNGFHSLWYMRDSIFFNLRLWWTTFIYVIIAISCAGLVFVNRRDGFRYGRLSAPQNIETLSQISGYFSFVIAIMLGMYVSTAVSRWWMLRDGCLGGLWSAIHDLLVLLSTRFPTEKDRALKEKILRLGLLSHRLVYAKARKLESTEVLQSIVNVGLMTPDELEALKDETAKAQICWLWISAIFVQLKVTGKIDAWFLGKLESLCSKATNSIVTAFSYIHTQIPFNYVHLLVTNVILSNLLLVAKCGFVIGGEETHKNANHFLFIAQLVEAIVVPFMYHAILGLAEELENPFGVDEVDFPCLSYHVIIRNECEAFIRQGENHPDSLLDIMEEGKKLPSEQKADEHKEKK